jgi:hypothetical protein
MIERSYPSLIADKNLNSPDGIYDLIRTGHTHAS